MIIVAMACATMALAACKSKEAQNVENAYDNQASAIDNQAENLARAADNVADNTAAATANVVDKLENKADALRKTGDAKADAVDDKK